MWKKILVAIAVLVCYLIPISVYAAPKQIPILYKVSDWRKLDQRGKELASVVYYTSYWTGIRDSILMFSEEENKKSFESMRQMLVLATPVSPKTFSDKVDELSAKAPDEDDILKYFYYAISFYLNKSADKLFEKYPEKEKPIGSGPKRNI
jgi:hypothetical protein